MTVNAWERRIVHAPPGHKTPVSQYLCHLVGYRGRLRRKGSGEQIGAGPSEYGDPHCAHYAREALRNDNSISVAEVGPAVVADAPVQCKLRSNVEGNARHLPV